MTKQIGVEVLETEAGYYCVELCNKDNRRITLRSYQPNEKKEAIDFAREVAIIIKAEWQSIRKAYPPIQ